jgi:hypothetical protein
MIGTLSSTESRQDFRRLNNGSRAGSFTYLRSKLVWCRDLADYFFERRS